MTRNQLENRLLHPHLIGIYPVLGLLSANILEIPPSDGLRALAISLLFSTVLTAAAIRLAGSRLKGALLASLVLAAFFAYGHLYLAFEAVGWFLGRHRFLVPVMALVVGAMALWIWRLKGSLVPLTSALNITAVVLVLLPLAQIGIVQIGLWQAPDSSANPSRLATAPGEVAPDIYYILLDGYPRGDILLNTFDHDNAPLLNYLTARGFYIADCSQANYSFTMASMAATLNMTYLDNKSGTRRIEVSDSRLGDLIRDSQVEALVDELGYTTVNFDTGYRWLRWRDPDVYLSPFSETENRFLVNTGINGFELLLVRSSAALIAFDLQVSQPDNQTLNLYDMLADSPKDVQRERLQFEFDMLQEIPTAIDGPKFVYAHITVPHPPYLYDSVGNEVLNEPSDEISAYREQVIYLNGHLESILETIFAGSDPEPIIVIQSDHGALIPYTAEGIDYREKIAILNAYYLPGVEPAALYKNITPVNTFRLIFDRYFGGSFGLLEDHSFLVDEPVDLGCQTPGS
jgi:predicted membrane protein